MSWINIWVHMIFATKYRTPFLHKDIRKDVFKHIKTNAINKGIQLDMVNGSTDHTHCLISLDSGQSMKSIAQQIKGESSRWINKYHMTEEHFVWQDDFWAVSVSQSQVDRVRRYIRNQEAHHQNKDFETEIKLFMDKYGWRYIPVTRGEGK